MKIYKTIILHVLLYVSETWSLTLRKEHRLRKSKNTVLRRTVGPMTEEVVGGWRRRLYQELHNIHTSLVIKSRMMR
jgi:hypothetical protein